MAKSLLALLTLPLLVTAQVQPPVAIRNAKIVTISGPVLNKGTIVLRNGLIEDLGENVIPPAGAWVIDGEGMTVYPGLIDPLSTLGIPPVVVTPGAPTTTTTTAAGPPARGPEDRPRTTSWERAADKIRNTDTRIDSARNAGFTSATTFPTTGIFAGQGVLFNLAGDNPSKMIVESPTGQFMSLTAGGGAGGGRSYPSSGMGVFAYVRQIFIDLDYYERAKAAYEKDPTGKQRPAYDRALEGVKESPRLLLPANSKVEIERVSLLAAELKKPYILYGVLEGYRSAAQLKAAGAPVLISTKWPTKSAGADPDGEEPLRILEFREQAPTTPSVLAKAGVKFALFSDGQTTAEFLKGVRTAIERGLAHDDAVKALTLSAAEMFGAGNRLGSLDKGKIANIVVTKGDLLSDKSSIQYVFVDGNKFIPSLDGPVTLPTGRGTGRPRNGGVE